MEERIKEVLASINEPIINKGFTELGFIYGIVMKGNTLKLKLGITDPDYKDIAELKNNITNKIKEQIKEIAKVEIDFVLGVVNHDNKQKSIVLPNVKNTIAIASGKGGVGKSTVAANIAVSLSKEGAKVGLIDADIYGPSIPIMLGVNDRPGIVQSGGKNKMLPVLSHGISLMSIGFLIEDDSAVVWRGPMASSALKQFMTEVEWGDLDFLLFDMPPGTGDIQLTLSQTVPLTGTVVVTTPQEISLADARKGHLMFEKVNVPNLGFIENMSYYLKPDGQKEHIFGQGGGKKLADEFNVELLGEIPIDTNIRIAGDNGTPISISNPDSPVSKIFKSIAKELIIEINKRNTQKEKRPGLEIIV
ncbi:MAG: iron-sulfur cluster carrier protein ApbC [Ignavibacteria bacterium]